MHIKRTSSDYIHDYKMDRGDLTADDGAQASQSRMQTVPGMPLGNSGGHSASHARDTSLVTDGDID